MAGIRGGLVLKQETPAGAIDGVNTTFTTTRPYVAGTLMVFVNGILQAPTDDYAESPPTVFTMVSAPSSGGGYTDKVRVAYQIA